MKLIIGLGNPGSAYENTRHNIGFMAIDKFASKYNATFNLETKFKGMIAPVIINGKKALLLKPMTYMNLSGESIIKVMQFYKIDVTDILVVVDDLDSSLGRVRIREKGSAGGHNGLKSIVNHIKTEEYKRIKIGIDRSPIIPVVDWVLKKFNSDELATVAPSIDKAIEAIEAFINDVSFNKISSLYSIK